MMAAATIPKALTRSLTARTSSRVLAIIPFTAVAQRRDKHSLPGERLAWRCIC
jgi:hypothetical protein